MFANNVISPGPSCPIQMEVGEYMRHDSQCVIRGVNYILQIQGIKYLLYASPQQIKLIGLWSVHQRQGQWKHLTVNCATTLSLLVEEPLLSIAK